VDQKLREFVSSLKYEEVLDIQQDLAVGGIRTKKIIKEKIKEFNTTHRKTCSICFNQIQPESTENYTILFGPESFKKKATFCALDCMFYFLQQLKEIKNTTTPTSLEE